MFLIHTADLSYHLVKGIVHSDALLCRGFTERAAKALGEIFAFLAGHLSIALQITLVADQHHREGIAVLDTSDLLVECIDFFKGQTRGDGVDQNEALAVSHVLLSHGAVFLLASRIQHIQQGGLVVDNALLAIGIYTRLS